MISEAVVYVDERLVVVNKPPGVSLATRRSEPQAAAQRLLELIPAEVQLSYGLDPARLWLVHRLDLGTTGLVILARDEDAHRELSRQFMDRLVQKTYLALVWGHPKPREGRYDLPIGPDRRDRRRMNIDFAGRPAVTEYRTLIAVPNVALVELHPETGRTHQLRVHLAHAGHWIVGDDLYAGARHRGVKSAALRTALNPSSIMLHAWRLELPESSTFNVRRFEAPLPVHFETVLEQLHIHVLDR